VVQVLLLLLLPLQQPIPMQSAQQERQAAQALTASRVQQERQASLSLRNIMSNLLRHAIVKEGVVVNTIEYETDHTNQTPEGLEGVIAIKTDKGNIGWVYRTNDFFDPVELAMTQAEKDARDAANAVAAAAVQKDQDDLTQAKTYAKLVALKNMSPAQIQNWVTNNVTTLAQVRDALATLAIAVSILARRL
jgi:hypothetical protein